MFVTPVHPDIFACDLCILVINQIPLLVNSILTYILLATMCPGYHLFPETPSPSRQYLKYECWLTRL